FMLWLLAQYSLFGLHPFWWHLVALATQAAAAVLVWMLARRLTGDDLTAGVAALIFALHPIHVEVAAWISGVTESLMAVFFIAALLCYLRRRDATEARGKLTAWLAASLALFALA